MKLLKEIQYYISPLVAPALFDAKKNRQVVLMVDEIHRLGGLNFGIEKHKEGWLAECTNVRGIMAGNKNPKPSSEEIDEFIKEAIFTAFKIPPYLYSQCSHLVHNTSAKKSKALVYV